MYTSYIGNKFLKIYREKNNLPDDYTARQFFDKELFPLFFDNEEHLMHVGNSPFFQKPTKKAVEEHGSKANAQLFNLHSKVTESVPSGAIFVGYGAENREATSSGQITSMSFDFGDNEIYASWIGQALAIGVSGGLSIQIDENEILWTLHEGWKNYRKYLSQTPNLKDKQIETWNGHWLRHAFSEYFHANNPLAEFDPKPEKVLGKLAIPTVDWIKVIFALSRQYPNQTITAYVYSLSQTNTTLGFINLQLPKVRNLIRLKGELYTLPKERQNHKNFEQMYSTFYNLKNAFKLGVIGLKALEPKNLRAFMPLTTAKYAQGKDYIFSDPNIKEKKHETVEDFEVRRQKAMDKYKGEVINFQIFKTWIRAMLNNKKQLNTLAIDVAQALIDFEEKSKNSETGRGKSTQSRLSEDVKSSTTLKLFIENLTALMKIHNEGAITFKKVKDAVIVLPSDLFPLFITLIRFEYQYKKSI
ncbi:hypothetical protein [uncultured Maribacter sp.]|uniref:hypothetical protein n=1 Tax=uncultured Maribacter sp. TaxID=431308 RepID=UPI002613F25D|nr:hypothetical protein [uncultured Maribacter sp.]